MPTLVVDPAKLRELRLLRALSMAALAERAGTRPATIHAIEHGRAARIGTIRKIAAALEVEPGAFTHLEAS